MSTTRLALCADTHFWPNAPQRFSDGAQMQPWSAAIQATLLAEISAANPDLLFHLGDMTCGGGSFAMPPDLFATTVTDLVAAFHQIPAHFYGLPGNHDCPPNGGDWALAEALLGLAAGQGSTVDTPQARLVLLHTQGHSAEQIAAAAPGDPIHGWVSPAELARLEKALATAGDQPVLLFCHQLLHPWGEDRPWADLYGIENGAEVLALLQRYGNVRAVFQAHAHRLNVQTVGVGDQPCWFIVIPAVIEYPMAWLELTLTPGQLQVQMRRLPLLDLAQQSLQSGGGDWRAGRPEWRNFAIPLLLERQ